MLSNDTVLTLPCYQITGSRHKDPLKLGELDESVKTELDQEDADNTNCTRPLYDLGCSAIHFVWVKRIGQSILWTAERGLNRTGPVPITLLGLFCRTSCMGYMHRPSIPWTAKVV